MNPYPLKTVGCSWCCEVVLLQDGATPGQNRHRHTGDRCRQSTIGGTESTGTDPVTQHSALPGRKFRLLWVLESGLTRH